MTDHATVLSHTRHWLEAAVIGLNLCPFAKSVYVKQQVRYVVSDARHLDAFLDQLDQELQLLASADPAEIDTTLLIHPSLFADFAQFNDLLLQLDDIVEDNGLSGVLQVASFHPRFCFEGCAEDDIGNYTNRAPYPTLHLLRESSIARAVAAIPEPEAIFERNIELLEEMGHAGWQKLGIANT